MIGKRGYSGGDGDNRERCSVLHCDRGCQHADRHVPSCGFRWSAVVWALVVAGVALVASVLVFFLAPSSVFGLPESGATSEETSIPADDDSGAAAGDSEITEVVSPDAVASPDSVSVDALGATLNMPYDGTISGTYADIARECMFNLGWFDNYVFYRSGQYEYIFAYGDSLEFSGGVDDVSGTFSSSTPCTILRISAPSTYTGAVTITSQSDTISLPTAGRLVYSNLGGFPQFDSMKYIFDEVMWLGMVAVGLHVLSSASRFVMRNGRSDG